MSFSEEMTEAEMMSACSPLYGTIAIESAASVIMGSMFFYLWMKISTKSELKAPFRAISRLTWYSLQGSAAEFLAHIKTWPLMNEATVAERFTLVKKISQVVLLFRGFTAFLAITRWLHIKNVNGFRWLAYACTCPLMQSQLIMMIAPVIPCYRMVNVFTVLITFFMLINGWIANLQPGHFLNCDLGQLLTWDDVCFDWTWKFKQVLVSGSILIFLNFVQIPILGLIYLAKGGGSNPLLPHGYIKLLFIVVSTWLCFPVWWFLSYEGIGYFQDTKFNSIGFALLNLISKGTMAFHILSMSMKHALESGAAGDTKIARELGMYRQRSGSVSSVGSSDDSGGHPEVKAALSVTAWLVKFLRNFDDGASMQLPQQQMYASTQPPPGAKGESPRVPRQELTDSTVASSAYGDGDSDTSPTRQQWDTLDPMYKRFLREAGVSQSTFENLPAMEKLSLREKFDKVAMAFGAHKGMPQWVCQGKGGYVLLGQATAAQLLAELHLRLEGGQCAKPRAPELEIQVQEDAVQRKMEVENDVEFVEPQGVVRRGFAV